VEIVNGINLICVDLEITERAVKLAGSFLGSGSGTVRRYSEEQAKQE
jgi:hypothetical protein